MNFFKKIFDFGREERKDILAKLKSIEEKLVEKKAPEEGKTPWTAIRQVDKTLIVVLCDEENPILTATDIPDDFYGNVKELKTKEEIKKFFNSFNNKELEIEEKVVNVVTKDDFYILRNNPDFEIVDDKVYLKGISLAIPDTVLAEIISNREEYTLCDSSLKEEAAQLDDYYNRLILFWAMLSNSPVKDRDNILLFCRKNDIRLSPLGNIIGYRRLVKWNTNKNKKRDINLQKFVEDSIVKIKKWKKNPANYVVYTSSSFEGYKITLESGISETHFKDANNNVLGKLTDLKEFEVEVEGKEQYTSWYSSGKYLVTIPSLYKMIDEKPDPNLQNCHSGGLHIGNVNFSFSEYGDTSVVCLINPSKTIFVPSDDTGKFRVSEMYVACLNPNEEGMHIDDSLIEQADKAYNRMTIDELKECYQSKSMDMLSIDKEHVPETTLEDVLSIAEILQNRIVKI